MCWGTSFSLLQHFFQSLWISNTFSLHLHIQFLIVSWTIVGIDTTVPWCTNCKSSAKKLIGIHDTPDGSMQVEEHPIYKWKKNEKCDSLVITGIPGFVSKVHTSIYHNNVIFSNYSHLILNYIAIYYFISIQ